MPPRHPLRRYAALAALTFVASSAPRFAVANDAYWSDAFDRAGPAAGIEVMAQFGGDVIVGGTFRNLAGQQGLDFIAAWDGQTFHPLGQGVSARVRCLLVLPGSLYVGGDFTAAGGQPAGHIARWDGQQWSDVGGGVSASWFGPRWIDALIEYQGDLIVGGEFDEAGGSGGYRNIARWDGQGWSPMDHAFWNFNNKITDFAIFNDQLVAAIDVTPSLGDVAIFDGQSWALLGQRVNIQLFELEVYNGELYVGGGNEDRCVPWAASLMRLSGVMWVEVGGGLRGSGNCTTSPSGLNGVRSLCVYNGKLLVGGFFVRAQNTPLKRLASWDGATWAEVGQGIPGNGNYSVRAILPQPQGLLVAGDFPAIAHIPAADFTLYDGQQWQPLQNPGGGLDGFVEALAYHQGQLVAGGAFQEAGTEGIPAIARWDGQAWNALGLGLQEAGGTPDVHALLAQGAQLYVGGRFDTAGGASALHVARWDGQSWSALGTGVDAEVGLLSSYQGNIVAAGDGITLAGGVRVAHIAQWDGSGWQPMGSGIPDGAGTSVRLWALHEFGGKLLAAIELLANGTTPLGYELRSYDGVGWSTFAAGSAGRVEAMATYQGELIIGGAFTDVNGTEALRIAKWDESAWHAFGPGIRSRVRAFAPFGDKLMIGGDIEFAYPYDFLHNMALLRDYRFVELATGVDGYPGVMAFAALGGSLYVGGGFNRAGGKPSYNIALYQDPTAVATPPAQRLGALLAIEQVFPNPSNPRTTIRYSLLRAGHVVLTVHDVRGRRVRTLVDGPQGEGTHAAVWDGRDDDVGAVSSGTCYVRLEGLGEVRTRKLMLQK